MRLNDDARFHADLVGSDQDSDLAVLRIGSPCGTPLCSIRRFRDIAGGSGRHRHRQSARILEERDHRRHLRIGADAARFHGPAHARCHSDGCGAESRKFGRSSRRFPRPGDRRQYGDDSAGAGDLLRHRNQHGKVGHRSIVCAWARTARLHWRVRRQRAPRDARRAPFQSAERQRGARRGGRAGQPGSRSQASSSATASLRWMARRSMESTACSGCSMPAASVGDCELQLLRRSDLVRVNLRPIELPG